MDEYPLGERDERFAAADMENGNPRPIWCCLAAP